jgi:hypothetical protein
MLVEQHQELPELWERPYSAKAGAFYYNAAYDTHITVPRTESEIPGSALPLLTNACGIDGLNQFFMLPMGVRPVGSLARKVITPQLVLAIGNSAVGLWTDWPEPGLRAVIDARDLFAITDIQILLYGELCFQSDDHRLTVRYNTVDREKIEPQLLRFRKLLWGPPGRIPPVSPDTSTLSYKWRYILETPFLREEGSAQPAFGFTNRQIRRRERNQVVVCTAQEFILMSDPEYPMNNYGVDRFLFPRSRMQEIRMEGDRLIIASRGASWNYRLHRELVPDVEKMISDLTFRRPPAVALSG